MFLTDFCASNLRPALYVPNIAHLDYRQLRRDFEVVIFDKDNCLTRPYQDAVLEYPGAVRECVDAFGADRVAVLSNCIGCEDGVGGEGGEAFRRLHGLAVIPHKVKKPGCMDAVQAFFPQTPPRKMVLVGDRLSTDIFMARKHGLFGVLVDPITNAGDNWAAVVVRWLERLWLRAHRVGWSLQTQQKYVKFIAD